jgi:hypothetical protein
LDDIYLEEINKEKRKKGQRSGGQECPARLDRGDQGEPGALAQS